MLERDVVTGDYLMWPNGDGRNGEPTETLVRVEYVGPDNIDKDKTVFSKMYIKTMQYDGFPTHMDDVTKADSDMDERYKARLKRVRFATPEEIEAGLQASGEYLCEEVKRFAERLEERRDGLALQMKWQKERQALMEAPVAVSA